MVPRVGSFKHVFAEKSKEKLLSQKEMDIELGFYRDDGSGCFNRIGNSIVYWCTGLRDLPQKAWEFGRSDPRRVIFAAKVGLALTLISLLILMNEPFKDVVTYAVWAILTVVLLFEFTIGATLSKGFNRGLGTLFAGGLSLGMAELSTMTGKWEEVMIFLSIFLIGFCATFLKMYPTVKQYEYGLRVFVLTYSIIMVSGYKTRAFIETAVSRFLMISIGVLVCLVVNICIYPIWAGEDLHNLVVKNFTGVANSLEGCVNGYLQCVEYERVPSKILTYQASNDPVYNGYRSAIESTSLEDTLEGFASWEPPHGRYKMLKYPWKNYIKVSGALRHCAFMVMALHGCILSEIQAPPERREVFSNEMKRVGTEGGKVLRELGNRIKKMVRLSPGDILLEVHDAAEELQKKIDRRSYLLVSSESWVIGNRADYANGDVERYRNAMDSDSTNLGFKSLSETVLDVRSFPQLSMSSRPAPGSLEISHRKEIPWPHRTSFNSDAATTNELDGTTTYESASALSLATFTSLLIEFVARLQNLVDSFEELSEKAKFKEPTEELLA